MNKFLFYINTFAVVFISLSVLYQTSLACTDFRIKAKDDTIVIGRSCEFGMPINSHLRTLPRGEKRISKDPKGGKGLTWTTKYGTLYFDSFGEDMLIDGINEKGLSVEGLYLPGYSTYHTVPENQYKNSMPNS
ncbi:MAG: linear amide C-N hydrolase, partial [Candidatus Theseobacter exili]|nr:linear amide C-N hydrolase [Candidatus Theseobacter exili]